MQSLQRLLTFFILSIVISNVIHSTSALFDNDPNTVQLTPDNYDKTVRQSPLLWYVLFYSPTCNFCKQFEPEYSTVARWLMSNNQVKFGAVNLQEFRSFFSRFYIIDSVPTVLVLDSNGLEKYSDANTAQAVNNHVLKRLG
jgi:thioredoxin-like negative regulator of GroEL